MKVIILGSGLLGITTAYVLAKRGHSVEVIERCGNCAAETSFANGGQLSYSHAEPWANPGVLKKLPKWLVKSDSPLIFRPRADWDMITWGLKFLSECRQSRADANTLAILRLGLYSRLKMATIREETGIKFDFLQKGILHIYSSDAEWEAAKKHAEFQAKFGCDQRVVSSQECLSLEPALAHTSRSIAGGIHAHMDESGDANLFCRELEKACKQIGVVFRYHVEVESIESSGDAITAITTSQGSIIGDAYVMALGSYSPIHLKPLGIRVPIYPMKGYSLTLSHNASSPSMSITDGSAKLVYSRLGSNLRIAGTAEFAGHDASLRPDRIAPIVRAAQKLFPNAAWDAPVSQWACLRPSTPGGAPILGETPYQNLYLNTGHGTLGWTQAAGSAYLVADIMEKRSPEIMTEGLALS